MPWSPGGWRLGWFLIVLILIVTVIWISSAKAHSYEIVHCSGNFKVNTAIKLSEVTLSNGLLAELYDTDAFFPLDGLVDIVAYSHILGWTPGGEVVEHREHPTIYEVDFDNDQEPDASYVDRYGEGRCEDIHLYQNFSNPKEGWPNYDEPPEGHA